MKRTSLALALLFGMGCDSILGFEHPSTRDSDAGSLSDGATLSDTAMLNDTATHDTAGGDVGTVPIGIQVSGVAYVVSASGRTPEAGVVMTAYKSFDNILATEGNTDSQGQFTLSIETGGSAVDDYLQASEGSKFLPTFVFFPKPLVASVSNREIILFSASTLSLAATLGNSSQTSGDGALVIQVVDASGNAVSGAILTATENGSPVGTIRYFSSGLPSKTAASTDIDGNAIVFSVTPGVVSVSASRPGLAFSAHDVDALANTVSESTIEP